jgi:small-conductance mechanosensitive channel
MPEPPAFDDLETLLTAPSAWLELVVVIACFVAGWLVDRRLEARKEERTPRLRLPGGVVRFAMPIVALLLLVVVRGIWRRWQPPLLLDVGVLLALALGLIRIALYTLRRLVPTATWLRTSERTIVFGIWALVALHVLGITPEIAAELDGIRLPIGKQEVTLLSVATGIAVVLITVSITLWLSGLVEQRLMRAQLDLSQRALAAKVVRAVLLVLGVLVAFQAIGFDLTLLSVFGGALGVGIGLGLQKLASNYIAGFVILLDRSIRLGDVITVSDRHGVVSEVTSRYVVVRSLDGVEAIVPNETLVTTTVLNHSFSRRAVRASITILVAYGTDVDQALATMVEVARGHPRVLQEETPPAAMVTRLGDIGIELELGVWIRDPENGVAGLRGDLNRDVWRAFQRAGIGVPVRTVEVRSLLPVNDVAGPGSAGAAGNVAGADPSKTSQGPSGGTSS